MAKGIGALFPFVSAGHAGEGQNLKSTQRSWPKAPRLGLLDACRGASSTALPAPRLCLSLPPTSGNSPPAPSRQARERFKRKCTPGGQAFIAACPLRHQRGTRDRREEPSEEVGTSHLHFLISGTLLDVLPSTATVLKYCILKDGGWANPFLGSARDKVPSFYATFSEKPPPWPLKWEHPTWQAPRRCSANGAFSTSIPSKRAEGVTSAEGGAAASRWGYPQ